jgi:hypothetical protein
MKTLFLTLLGIGLAFVSLNAQDVNPDIFRKNIDILYDAAAKGFKDIKTEQNGTTPSGDSKFHSTKKVSGATEVYIQVDAEQSHTYVAHFQAKDMEAAKTMVEELTTMILEQVASKGFHRSSGTELNYEGYRKQTVEYESDNIDLLGKYPSFSVGILKGSGGPFVVELIINEPLWK